MEIYKFFAQNILISILLPATRSFASCPLTSYHKISNCQAATASLHTPYSVLDVAEKLTKLASGTTEQREATAGEYAHRHLYTDKALPIYESEGEGSVLLSLFCYPVHRALFMGQMKRHDWYCKITNVTESESDFVFCNIVLELDLCIWQ